MWYELKLNFQPETELAEGDVDLLDIAYMLAEALKVKQIRVVNVTNISIIPRLPQGME